MKHTLLIFYILLIICSCAKDDAINLSCETGINTPIPSDECVSTENITSLDSNFIMLNKGLQEEGFTKGIKINEEWEASVFINQNDTSFRVVLKTYWNDIPSSFLTGEVISLINIPINNSKGCYNLTSNFPTTDSIFCGYIVSEEDINLVQYTLDESKENKLEILEYDQATGILKAKMKASFITDEAVAPDFPEEVRFFNVDIETY